MSVVVTLATPAQAATFSVTRTDDPAPDGCATNGCSLREAIMAANDAGGLDEVQLQSGQTYTLSIPSGEAVEGVDDAAGDLDITDDLNITVPGGGMATVDGQASFTITTDMTPGEETETVDWQEGPFSDRIFHIWGEESDVSVNMSNLTVTGGVIPLLGGGIYNQIGDLTLTNVTISGNGTNSSCCGGGLATFGGTSTVTGSTFTNNVASGCCGGAVYNENAIVNIMDTDFDDNHAPDCCGGAIYSWSDPGDLGEGFPATALTIGDGSTFTNNSAFDCCGGAIMSDAQGAAMSTDITDTVFTGNSAFFCCGGAIYNESEWGDEPSSVMTIHGSVIEGNSAENCCGGGILNDGNSELTVRDSSISNNSAAGCCGGGVSSFGDGYFTRLTRVAIVGNTVTGDATAGNSCCGAGVFLQNDGETQIFESVIANNSTRDCCGGGVSQFGGSLLMKNVTISGNTSGGNTDDASRSGGGIYTESGSIEGDHVTITDNRLGAGATGASGIVNGDPGQSESESDVYLESSIVAGNVEDPQCLGPIDGMYSLDSDGSCFSAGDGNLLDTDPMLGPLANNGGGTLTHALNVDSPAVDHIPAAECSGSGEDQEGAGFQIHSESYDQRGLPRPVDGNGDETNGCDIGAFELQLRVSEADLELIKVAPGQVTTGTAFDYDILVRNAVDSDEATGLTVTDALPANVDFVSASTVGGTCTYNGGTHTVTCTYASLGAGESRNITITVTPTQAGQLSNTAQVAADAPLDPAQQNNSDTANTSVQDQQPPPGPGVDPDSIRCEPRNAVNTVGTVHTITCVVRDPDGAPKAGTEVSFSETGPGSFSPAQDLTPVTNAAGEVTIEVTSDQPGLQQISALISSDQDSVTKEWVTQPVPQCADGIDNDADGAVDLEDEGCTSPEDDDESDEEEPGLIVNSGPCRGLEQGSEQDLPAGNFIVGTSGDDILTGTSGDDIICGLGGDDVIDGGGGDDLIVGNAGNDTIDARGGDDTVRGGAGDDTIRGNRNADTLRGNAGKDTLQGGKGHDELFGGGGEDTLKGFTGNDDLDGGGGTDTCNGGSGSNSFTSCEV